MPTFKSLLGRTFGRLKVIEQIPNINRRTAWRCQCECGGTKETTGDNLICGKTQSCGCLWDEAMVVHGGYLDPVYSVWRNMNVRCHNPKNPKWHRYGGRGIKVVDRWSSYAAFKADMGPRPDGYTLERIDNDGDYGPNNCIWADRSQQNRNTSKTRFVTFGGSTKPLIEWCDIMNINHEVVARRLNTGWSVEQALTTPQNAGTPRNTPRPHLSSLLSFKGKTMTIKEWGEYYGIKPEVIAMRLGRQWKLDAALTTPIKH